MIPKIIHLVWIPSWSSAPAYALKNAEAWSELNPDYTVIKWSEPDVIKLMPDNWKKAYSSLNLDVKKADFARLVVLYSYGGNYFDCDLIPHRPLEYFYSKSKIETVNPKRDTRKRIWFPRKISVNLQERNLILTREWRSGSGVPYRIANGYFSVKPASKIILDFLLKHYKNTNNKVLWYLGPQALSQFIRDNVKKLIDDTIVLSPQHFLWEGKNRPKWSVSSHPPISNKDKHWGDHSKHDYWNV